MVLTNNRFNMLGWSIPKILAGIISSIDPCYWDITGQDWYSSKEHNTAASGSCKIKVQYNPIHFKRLIFLSPAYKYYPTITALFFGPYIYNTYIIEHYGGGTLIGWHCDTVTNKPNRWAIKLPMEQYFGNLFYNWPINALILFHK